jgi:site-specific recombinase XerD
MLHRHVEAALVRIARIRKRFKQPLPEGVTEVNGKFKVDTRQIDIHALRYTFITEMISGGMDPKSVQYLAGHKSIQTTLAIYAQFRGGKVEDAIQGLPWA